MPAIFSGIIVAFGLGCLGFLAPLPSNARAAVLSAVIAAVAAVLAGYGLIVAGTVPQAAIQPLTTAVLVFGFLTAWRVIGGPGTKANPLDVWARPRTDGLSPGMFLQLHVAGALIVAAGLWALAVALTKAPMLRHARVESLPMPALCDVGVVLALLIFGELLRNRRGVAVTGTALSLGQAFGLCLWRWTFLAWVGLVTGLVLVRPPAKEAEFGPLIAIFVVLFVAVPALGIICARLLELRTGTRLLALPTRRPPASAGRPPSLHSSSR